MLRIAYPVLRPYLVEIFNTSIERGEFPDCWRTASILPLAKTQPPATPSDTRPIALLPELSKLFERIIHDQLSQYLNAHHLLDAYQSGFRPRHSTQTALLGFTEEARLAIDRRQVTLLMLFDFSKAFDTVSHKLILAKLRALNCSDRVIRWFASYLRDRRQVICDEDGNSSIPIQTFTGVPQGSVLGPLLFAIFINDLPLALLHSKHGIYADDTRIFLHCYPSELSEYIKKLSDDATRVSAWARRNQITLNPAKTKLIVIGSQPYIASLNIPSLPTVVIDGVAVQYSFNVSDLGVQLSSDLSWTRHVNQISSRVHGALYSLRRHKHALPRELRKRLVETLIFPHFDYACVVYNDVSKELNLKLNRLLNRCVRFVYGSIPWRSPVTPYRLSLGWLTVEDRRLLFSAVLAFSVISTGQPAYLSQLFTRRDEVEPRRVTPRHPPPPLLFTVSRTRTCEASFHKVSSRFLNSLGDRLVPFDPRLVNRLKLIAREVLVHGEVISWRSRVSSDSSLVLNPVPGDTVLAGLLNA